MKSSVIASAAYFTVVHERHFLCGVITLALGQQQRKVLCRQHAYIQLKGLEHSGEIDEFEAMHLRSQIENSQLPLVPPSEMADSLQALTSESAEADRGVFAKDYFHPAVEELLTEAAADVLTQVVTQDRSLLQ